MASAALKMRRITRERPYLERARRIFALHKSRFQLVDGKTRHWVGVHPYRNYQAGEVAKIVEAYHTGVVFDRTDIERILHTNLKLMWNGERRRPQFRNSDATLPRPPREQKVTAGTLWTALEPFSQTVRDLQRPESPLARVYFENVTCAAPPGFARKHAGGMVAGFDFAFHECREIHMAAALPSAIRAGEETLLAANVLGPRRGAGRAPAGGPGNRAPRGPGQRPAAGALERGTPGRVPGAVELRGRRLPGVPGNRPRVAIS